MNTRTRCLTLLLSVTVTIAVHAQETTTTLDAREQQIRDRYEQVLQRTPMQDSAFDRVYQSYLAVEGVDAWIAKITPADEATTPESLVLLGRIQERQFKTPEAIASLEKAREGGVQDPQLDLLLGRLYYENGQDDDAAVLLTTALEQSLAPEARADVVRILGSLYLRQGKRDEAIAAWKRLTEDNPDDTFALLELAEIYEDNRMWAEAVATYTQLAERSTNDPYQQCRALRSVGRAYIQMEAYPDAIAAFEKALALVAPGNWLFDDLKLRLVGVYQDLGDLPGLATYINEKLMENPGDTEFRDLLAETYTRMARFDEAEDQHKQILERDPGRTATYERLIALYERQERPADVAATYEALIARYPTEPEYLRRLGEVHLRQHDPEAAKAAWRRLLDEAPTAGQHAQLAEWLEQYEFGAEAITEYEAALVLDSNKDWTFRLAALKHANGQEDAARTLWTSVLNAESTAAERAEVAAILESFDYRDAAEPILMAALGQEPENLELAHALARNRMAQEKYEEALPLFETMAAQSENAYFQERGETGLLDAYTRMGILAEKKEAWENLARDNPDDPGQLMRLARLYARSGDTAGALALYERCVELQPENAEFLHILARAYVRDHRTTDAIEHYQHLVALDANRAGGYYRELLDIYLNADFKEEAIATAQKIVELAPSDAEAYLDLGQVYLTYQQHDAGLAAYRSALRLAPDEPNYYRQYGQALQGQQRFGEAQDAYRKMLDAAQEDDTRLQAVALLAQVYQYQGKIDALVAEFQGRVRNTPKRLAAYEELAAIHEQAGDVTRSVEVLENSFNAVDDKAAALKSLVRASYDAQDFDRVVRYFEDLIALSGKASAYEYERLGKVYLQLGDVEQAKRTWQRIVDEEPDDPQAYITLAKALRDGGFEEESMAATEAALAKDPHNVTLRFAYARDLARFEDMGKAYDQLKLLLELGPSAEDATRARENAAREKKVDPIARNQASYQRLNQFSPNYRPGRSGYVGGPAQRGTFEALRPQVIATMAGMAENSVGLESFIEAYETRARENPGSEEAFNDLILVYETTDRPDEARAATEALLALRPDDVELLDRLAVQYAADGDADKALETLARIDVLEPTRQKENDFARVYLYYRAERRDEGRALIQRYLQESTGDLMALNLVINVASQFNEPDLLLALEGHLDDLEPRYRANIQYTLARNYVQMGNIDEAKKISESMLFEPDTNNMIAYRLPRGNRVSIYIPQPQGNNSSRIYSRGLGQLRSSGILQRIDGHRTNAFEILLRLLDGEEKAALLQRVRAEVDQFATADSNADRERAWEFAMLYAGQRMLDGEFEEARTIVAPFLAGNLANVSAYNLANAINEELEDYDAMLANYETLRGIYPGQVREIVQAEVSTLMLAERYDAAVERIQELARRGTPPNDLVALIQQLQQADKPDLARSLLEEQLSGLQRNPQALSVLAAIYAEENNSEKAMELAREAWERQARGTTRASSMYFSYGGYYLSSGLSVDENLRAWYRYASDAGQGDELVAEFEARVAQQPGSILAHEHLAALYTLADKRSKAIDLYKTLIEKRPHYTKAQTTLAQLYEQAGQYNEAIALYESFIRTRPSLYNNMSWQVRRLYQRVGKGEELARIEEDLVKQARTPDQLQQLAYQFRNSGELEKSAELFEKAINMQPDQSWYRIQLAQVLQDLGRAEDALAVYETWYTASATRSRGHIDQQLLAQMVGQYKALQRLDEIRARTEATLVDKPDDVIARSVQAHVAMAEHRFIDAEAVFLEVSKVRPDAHIINMLLEMADYQNTTVALIEKLAADTQIQNFSDHQRLARTYMAAGNREKAMEHWDKFAAQQGNWGFRSVIQELLNFGLDDEAVAYYREHRKKAPEMGEIVVEMYLEGHALEGLIDELLQGEVKGPVEGLVKRLVNDQRTTYARGVGILAPLLARDPENRFLLDQLSRLHQRNDQPTEALPYAERALALQPHDVHLRRELADIFVLLGREAEAFQLYDDLLAEKLNGENALAALGFYLQQNHLRNARDLRTRAVEVLDAKDREEMDQQLARDAGRRGQARASADQFKAIFDAEPNEANFQTYLQFLLQAGYGDEAYALCMSHADSGLLSSRTLNDTNLGTAIIQYGNLNDIVPVLWNYLRHSERWDRDNQLRQMAQSYGNAGYGRQLLDALRKRAFAEDPPFRPLLLLLAEHYRELGDGPTALAIIDALMVERPGQRTLVAKKAEVLQYLERHDEAIVVWASMPGASTLSMEASDQIVLVRACLAAGRNAEANDIIEALTTWNKSDGTAGEIGRALFQAEQFDAALPWLERGMGDINLRQQICGDMVQCYLAVGDTESARRTWEENRSQRGMNDLDHGLDDRAHPDFARIVYASRLADEPANRELWKKLTDLLLYTRDTDGALDLFRRQIEVVPAGRVDDVINDLGARLAEHDQLLPLFDTPPLEEPNLVRAMVAGFRNLPEEQRTDALREQVLALPLSEVDDVIRLALFFRGAERNDIAIAQYQRALAMPDITERDQWRVLQALDEVDALDDAAGPVRALLEEHPTILRNFSGLLAFVARQGNVALMETVLDRIRERQPESDALTFYEKLTAYYAGDPAGRDGLIAFAGNAVLQEDQWRRLARIFAEAGDKVTEAAMLQRIADGGYGVSTRDRALAELCVLHAEAGRLREAFDHYLAISPAYGDRVGLMYIIAKHATAEALPALESAVLTHAESHPGNVMVPDALGLVMQLARRTGLPGDTVAERAAALLGAAQYRDVQQWESLIEGWKISPRIDVDDEDFMDTVNTQAYLNAEGAPTDTTGWTSIDARESLGIISLGDYLFGDEEPMARAGAYAWTTIEQVHGGPVEFTFAANPQQAQVWVNGTLAHTARHQDQVRPGQTRFMIDLRPGKNHIVVKSEHRNKRWFFCLGPVVAEVEPTPDASNPVETPATIAPVP